MMGVSHSDTLTRVSNYQSIINYRHHLHIIAIPYLIIHQLSTFPTSRTYNYSSDYHKELANICFGALDVLS